VVGQPARIAASRRPTDRLLRRSSQAVRQPTPLQVVGRISLSGSDCYSPWFTALSGTQRARRSSLGYEPYDARLRCLAWSLIAALASVSGHSASTPDLGVSRVAPYPATSSAQIRAQIWLLTGGIAVVAIASVSGLFGKQAYVCKARPRSLPYRPGVAVRACGLRLDRARDGHDGELALRGRLVVYKSAECAVAGARLRSSGRLARCAAARCRALSRLHDWLHRPRRPKMLPVNLFHPPVSRV
jgi:hypothetical protein